MIEVKEGRLLMHLKETSFLSKQWGPSHNSGTYGPQKCEYHDDLYARGSKKLFRYFQSLG